MSDENVPAIKRTRTMEPAGSQSAYRQRKVSVPAKRDATAPLPVALGKLMPSEIAFLKAYFRTGTLTAAYRRIHENASAPTCWAKGSFIWKKIRLKLSQEELLEIGGVSIGNVTRVLADGMNATFKRSFVARDGTVIESPEYPDHAIRVDAAKTAVKLLKLIDNGDDGEIRVTITQYGDPDAPPWPNSN